MHLGRNLVAAFLAAGLPLVAGAQPYPVGGEFQVNTYTTDSQERASASTGIIVWQSEGQDGDSTGIYGQRYDTAGVAQGPEFRVNTTTANAQSGPSVSSANNGDFVVVWESIQAGDSLNGIFGQRFASNGAAVGGEFHVNTYSTDVQINPAVSRAPNGGFVVVWQSLGQDGSGFGIFAQRFAGTGAPLGTEFRVNSFPAGAQTEPAVDHTLTGLFSVAWQSDGQDGDDAGIFLQRYTTGGEPEGLEFQVNTYVFNAQVAPALNRSELDEVVVWESIDQNGADGVYAQRYQFGVVQGAEFQVNSSVLEYLGPVAVSGPPTSAGFVAVWPNGDGAGRGLFGQVFNVNGIPVNVEFQVNSYTPLTQQNPALNITSASSFMVAWESGDATANGPDGSKFGISAQLYSSTPQPTPGASPTQTRTPTRTPTPTPTGPTPTPTVTPTSIPIPGPGGEPVVFSGTLQPGEQHSLPFTITLPRAGSGFFISLAARRGSQRGIVPNGPACEVDLSLRDPDDLLLLDRQLLQLEPQRFFAPAKDGTWTMVVGASQACTEPEPYEVIVTQVVGIAAQPSYWRPALILLLVGTLLLGPTRLRKRRTKRINLS